jgi:hypothetical protein
LNAWSTQRLERRFVASEASAQNAWKEIDGERMCRLLAIGVYQQRTDAPIQATANVLVESGAVVDAVDVKNEAHFIRNEVNYVAFITIFGTLIHTCGQCPT